LYFATFLKIKILDPGKSTAFKALVVEGEPIRIPEQQFHAITSATKENEYVTADRIHSEVRCDETRKCIKRESHVDDLRADENSCWWMNIQHGRT